jgi:hypothetical protein
MVVVIVVVIVIIMIVVLIVVLVVVIIVVLIVVVIVVSQYLQRFTCISIATGMVFSFDDGEASKRQKTLVNYVLICVQFQTKKYQ